MSDRAQAEKEKIARLRFHANRLTGDRWMIDQDDAGTHLLTVRRTGETAILATFHRDAQQDEIELIGDALALLFWFIDMFDRARGKVLELQRQLGLETAPPEERHGDYTTQVSILLSDRVFWRFLETRGAGGPVRDKQAADTRLKTVLAISSKKQLNQDERARGAWRSLNRDFLNWRAGG